VSGRSSTGALGEGVERSKHAGRLVSSISSGSRHLAQCSDLDKFFDSRVCAHHGDFELLLKKRQVEYGMLEHDINRSPHDRLRSTGEHLAPLVPDLP
jgi:hypothetical protein